MMKEKSQEKDWWLVIHAFDAQEKFVAARLVEVSATVDMLNRLALALSCYFKVRDLNDVMEGREEPKVWEMLGKVVSEFPHSPSPRTLRIMSALPAAK